MSYSIFDLFKIGIGPSSSHTVGPMIAAMQFVESFQKRNSLNNISRVKVELFGSLGATGKGHGSLKAIMMGLEGESPSTIDIDSIDSRIEKILENKKLCLGGTDKIDFDDKSDITLYRKKKLPFHSNGMRFRAYAKNKDCIFDKHYYSIGGGFVVNDEQINQSADSSGKSIDLAYPFTTGRELLEIYQNADMKISQIMLANELTWNDEKSIASQLNSLWEVMQTCVKRGCDMEGELPGGLKVRRRAKALHQRLLNAENRQDDKQDPLTTIDWVTLYALAVNEENASGGRIVTAPTNGAAGIIPAVLHYYKSFIPGANIEGVHEFLLTAAAIGILFKKNASISGAEVGCQGEVGSACSMAAAGLTAVLGGSPEQIENAAEIAMEHNLGLTCDPIGGLVQIPCIERNAVASIKAIHAARMALSNDGSHFVSLDKVIETMRQTGIDMLDKYKETSRGGLATNVVEISVNNIEC